MARFGRILSCEFPEFPKSGPQFLCSNSRRASKMQNADLKSVEKVVKNHL
jgi:hypothetical protein